MQNSQILLHDFEKRVLSQFGEDGMLEAVFERIGTYNKYFVEFGSNGREDGMGNTPYLRRFGWTGLLMDGSETPYNEKHTKDYDVKIEFIRADNINNLLIKYNVPFVFDLLSIDIDGQDFHVWNALDDTQHRPRVVIIESAFHMEPPLDLVQTYNPYYVWDGSSKWGSSPVAMAKLGKKKGYTLVGMTGADMIFIETKILDGNNVSFLYQDDVETLYKMNEGSWSSFDQDYFRHKRFWKPSYTQLNVNYPRYRTYFECRRPVDRITTKLGYKLKKIKRLLLRNEDEQR